MNYLKTTIKRREKGSDSGYGLAVLFSCEFSDEKKHQHINI